MELTSCGMQGSLVGSRRTTDRFLAVHEIRKCSPRQLRQSPHKIAVEASGTFYQFTCDNKTISTSGEIVVGLVVTGSVQCVLCWP